MLTKLGYLNRIGVFEKKVVIKRVVFAGQLVFFEKKSKFWARKYQTKIHKKNWNIRWNPKCVYG